MDLSCPPNKSKIFAIILRFVVVVEDAVDVFDEIRLFFERDTNARTAVDEAMVNISNDGITKTFMIFGLGK